MATDLGWLGQVSVGILVPRMERAANLVALQANWLAVQLPAALFNPLVAPRERPQVRARPDDPLREGCVIRIEEGLPRGAGRAGRGFGGHPS